MIVVEFSVIPLGTKTPSVSKHVAAAIRALEGLGIKAELTGMGTIFEATSMKTAFTAIEKAHNAVFEAGAKRAVTSVRIDERRDKESSIKRKIKAVRKLTKQ
ncbi:MAG: MTH1187 family thiamine-binding protein [Candidatus Diapherotrites archaeon]|nr:MTH1187 family thiamine-binding protein [Candidatus Diapherotrites archaeon]